MFHDTNLIVLGLEQRHGRRPRACGMHKLGPSGDGNQMPFSGASEHLLYGLSHSCLPYEFNCYHSAELLIKQGLREFVLWYLDKGINT